MGKTRLNVLDEVGVGHFLIAIKIFQMGNRKSKKTPPEPSAPSLSSDNEGRELSDFGSPYRYNFSEELVD